MSGVASLASHRGRFFRVPARSRGQVAVMTIAPGAGYAPPEY